MSALLMVHVHMIAVVGKKTLQDNKQPRTASPERVREAPLVDLRDSRLSAADPAFSCPVVGLRGHRLTKCIVVIFT